MEYRQILQSSRTGHRTVLQDIQFTPPPINSRASTGHPAILPLLFPFLSLSLTAETLGIHWLTLPPASTLFLSPWLLPAILSLLFPFLPLPLTADTLGIHWLTLPPASTLFHSPWPPPATLSLLFPLLSLSLTAESLGIHWLTLPPASTLFHSPWLLLATCCIVITPNPLKYGAVALIRVCYEALSLETTTRPACSLPPYPTPLDASCGQCE